MTEKELALIEYWLKTHKIKQVGDQRDTKDIHISYVKLSKQG